MENEDGEPSRREEPTTRKTSPHVSRECTEAALLKSLDAAQKSRMIYRQSVLFEIASRGVIALATIDESAGQYVILPGPVVLAYIAQCVMEGKEPPDPSAFLDVTRWKLDNLPGLN